MSQYNNRNHLSKELFTHFLQAYSKIHNSSEAYSNLLSQLVNYQGLNSNLCTTISQLVPYLSTARDLGLVLEYIVSNVSAARAKGDFIFLLEILLKKMGSSLVHEVLRQAFICPSIPYRSLFLPPALGRKLKGFLFIFPSICVSSVVFTDE